MPLDRIGEATSPAVVEDGAGLLELRWPGGQQTATVELSAALLVELLRRANDGRRALNVLGEVAAALTKLGDA